MMSLTRKRITGGALALAAALLLSAAASFAQHGGMPGHPGGVRGHHFGPGGPGEHESLVEHFGRALDLTDAQKAQIRQIEEGFRESTKSLHKQLRQAGPGAGPFAGLKDGAFDEAAVRAAAQARANLHVELEVAHAKLMSQVYAVLTAEQKAKVAEMLKRFEEGHRPPAPGGENF